MPPGRSVCEVALSLCSFVALGEPGTCPGLFACAMGMSELSYVVCPEERLCVCLVLSYLTFIATVKQKADW